MVTISTARALALSLPEATEKSHFETPDFRVRNKIFATLHKDKKRMVVKLSLVDQSVFSSFDKDVMYPIPNGWGRQGWTFIELSKVKKPMLTDALTTAWKTVAPPTLVKHYFSEADDTQQKQKHAPQKNELKTKVTDGSVLQFLRKITDAKRKADCIELLGLLEKFTGHPAKMWGSSIVGFGDYHYKYATGREGDWFITGFSPRKKDITLYFSGGLEALAAQLKKLGKVKTGKSCVYLPSLANIDSKLLKEMIKVNAGQLRKRISSAKK